jgi:hypothetical protein
MSTGAMTSRTTEAKLICYNCNMTGHLWENPLVCFWCTRPGHYMKNCRFGSRNGNDKSKLIPRYNMSETN